MERPAGTSPTAPAVTDAMRALGERYPQFQTAQSSQERDTALIEIILQQGREIDSLRTKADLAVLFAQALTLKDQEIEHLNDRITGLRDDIMRFTSGIDNRLADRAPMLEVVLIKEHIDALEQGISHRDLVAIRSALKSQEPSNLKMAQLALLPQLSLEFPGPFMVGRFMSLTVEEEAFDLLPFRLDYLMARAAYELYTKKLGEETVKTQIKAFLLTFLLEDNSSESRDNFCNKIVDFIKNPEEGPLSQSIFSWIRSAMNVSEKEQKCKQMAQTLVSALKATLTRIKERP